MRSIQEHRGWYNGDAGTKQSYTEILPQYNVIAADTNV